MLDGSSAHSASSSTTDSVTMRLGNKEGKAMEEEEEDGHSSSHKAAAHPRLFSRSFLFLFPHHLDSVLFLVIVVLDSPRAGSLCSSSEGQTFITLS